MYVRTAEALGQVPLLHSFFAGTLGQPALSPESQNFLGRVQRSPQDYEAVLLTRALTRTLGGASHCYTESARLNC